MGLMYFFFKNFFGGPTKTVPREEMLVPKFQRSLPVDLSVFLSEYPDLRNLTSNDELVWRETDLPLATASQRSQTVVYSPSKAVQNNGTLYVHALFIPSGVSTDPQDPEYDPSAFLIKSHSVVTFAPRPKRKVGMNLLSGEAAERRPEEELAADEGPVEWMAFLKPNITITMVDDFTSYPADKVPEHIQKAIRVDFEKMSYFPPIFFNDFWLLKDYMIPMNDTVTQIPLYFTVGGLSGIKYMLYNQAEQSFNMQSSMGALADGDQDEFKRILLEGNPIFLGITMVVSLLHSVFDMLAFKNDIGFWKNKKNVQGLSVRTISINCFCQAVIFLYLLDNNTSYVVLGSAGVGTLIEFWKITKAVDVSIDRSGSIPKLRFKDKAGYSDTKTKQFDKEAMVYLSYALYPIVIGYAIYALKFETHKSWYSWILNSLVGAVYTFGFILMCPQLYLNYRLKSVAHLPWRQMTYKFLNTIIDDLFAFVIKMPTLHRLSVFRDDLVFLVYIYQRWAYRVDKKRANEFGYSEEAGVEDVALLKDAAASSGGDPVEATQGDAQNAITEDTLRHRTEPGVKSENGVVAEEAPAAIAPLPTDTKKAK